MTCSNTAEPTIPPWELSSPRGVHLIVCVEEASVMQLATAHHSDHSLAMCTYSQLMFKAAKCRPLVTSLHQRLF